MYILVYIIDPANTLYFIEENHFTTKKEFAYRFETIEKAYEEQKKYPFSLEIKKI